MAQFGNGYVALEVGPSFEKVVQSCETIRRLRDVLPQTAAWPLMSITGTSGALGATHAGNGVGATGSGETASRHPLAEVRARELKLTKGKAFPICVCKTPRTSLSSTPSCAYWLSPQHLIFSGSSVEVTLLVESSLPSGTNTAHMCIAWGEETASRFTRQPVPRSTNGKPSPISAATSPRWSSFSTPKPSCPPYWPWLLIPKHLTWPVSKDAQVDKPISATSTTRRGRHDASFPKSTIVARSS
mmetsp:Transcript_3145/g.10998  ORF Transcript_3145/g.10998 Transcript_3145/m.10998 type:complete len:243 (-) Transcript_3145:2771-3499(-)